MFCGNCGKEIEEGNKFCTNCGKQIKGESQDNSGLANDIKSVKCVSEYSDDIFADKMDTVKFGKYPQSDASGEKVEEIEWLVLKKENEKVLLVSKNVLDCQKYDMDGYKKSWTESSLRKWLNDNFYDIAFSDNEKKKIIESDNKNKIALGYEEFNDDIDSKDKVFLLSILELQTTFKNKLNSDFLRLCAKPTKYAMACKYDEKKNSLKLTTENHEYLNKWAEGTCWYWLRDIVDSGNAGVINGNGSVGYTCGLEQNYSGGAGVRPAIWVRA